MDINTFWNKLKEHEGETFKTTRGLEFTYELSTSGNSIRTTRTKTDLPISSFEKAIELNPRIASEMKDIIYGYSYIFALIKDQRMQ